MDTENAADLTSATTITAEQVANGGYVISDGGEYILKGGNYQGNYILINTSDDVTLTLDDDITCPDGNFLFVDDDDSPSCNIVINGNGHAITGTGKAFSGLISIMDSAATVKLNKVLLNSKDNSAISMSSGAAALNLTINNSKLLSSSSPTVEFGSSSATSTLTIKGASVISSNSDSSNASAVSLYGACNFTLADSSSISGGAFGVYVTPLGASAVTTVNLSGGTIEYATKAGVMWETLSSVADQLVLSGTEFHNEGVDILLPNVDSSNTSCSNNVQLQVSKLTSDVTLSFPNVKNSFWAGFCSSDDAFAHLKTDKGALELDEIGYFKYTASGSSTTKKDPDAANYVVKTKNATYGKDPTDAVTAGDTYSVVVDVNNTGFNAGAAPWNDEYEIKYRAAGTEDWDSTLPTKPGTYYVQFYVEGTKNFNAGWVSGEDLKFTISKPELTLNDFYFISSVGRVYQNYTITDENLSITTVYYDDDNNEVTDLDTYGHPKKLGTYKVGFRVDESNTYQAYDSNGPVSGWTFTVKPAPEATNFKVTLTVNDTPYDLDTDTVVVPYGADYEVKASEIGSSTSMVYPCYRKASEPYASWTLFENGYPTEPDTYQIGLEVIAFSDASYGSGYVTKDNWVFTIGTPKQTPDPAAYAVTYDGSKQESYAMPYSEFEENSYKTLGDLPLGYEVNSAVDVSKYGKASLHYYKATQNKGTFVSSDLFSIDYDTEYQADADLTPGAIYYVVVETAGSDDYTAARYTDNGMYILIGKPDPEAANYGVMLAGDGPLTADSSVPFGSSWRILAQGTTGSGTGAVEKILYRKAESTTAVWSNEQPTVPGTYAVALKVAEGDQYASASALTCDDWRITINKGKLSLTEDTLTQYVDFENGKVVTKDDQLGEVTTLYYDAGGNLVTDTDLDEDGLPKAAGQYTIGFKVAESDYYEEIPETKTDWTYTVKANPEPQNYTVTITGQEDPDADMDKVFIYGTPIQVTATPNEGAGEVESIYYAEVKNGMPDLDNPIYSTNFLYPATFEVVLCVQGNDTYNPKKDLYSGMWSFTIERAELDADDFNRIEYDQSTGKFTGLPIGVEPDNISLKYYKNGELVTDLVEDADGKRVPRVGGTYEVGFQLAESKYYTAAESDGPVAGQTYTVAPHKLALADLTVTVDGEDYTTGEPSFSYTGDAVEVKVTAPKDIQPVGDITITYEDSQGTVLTEAPTEAGSYTCIIKVAASDNNEELIEYLHFSITAKTDLTADDIAVTVPSNVREDDESGFDVKFESKNETALSTDDLEITYYDAEGNKLAEAPTKAGKYTYKITVKADSDAANNFGADAVLTGEYTILSTEPTITGGELTTEEPNAPLIPGTKVTIKAPADTDTNVFQQWVISVDGVEVQPTKEDLKEKLGVDVEDDEAALAALQDPEFTFTMPEGKLSIYALTSNPQQEAFEKAVGTTLIVGGAAAATGAVYYFGTTAYIRSQLPEGMAVPQNREQLAVALWTLAGKPATESTAVFTDVAADSEALPAIRWAVETGVMSANTTEDGTSFYAGNYVTRAETAYRIYKMQQQRAE